MSTKLNPPSFRFPHNISGKVHPDVEAAITDTFNGLVDNMQAWTSLKGTLDTLQTQVKTATTPGSPTNTVVTVLSTQFPGLGTVTDLTGITAYTTQTSDNGAVLEIDDASPTNLTLNSTVATPYFFFATNLGTGTAVLTPTSGLINGAASFNLSPNQTAIVTFEGIDWVASGIVTNAAYVNVSNTFTPIQKFTNGLQIGTAPAVATLVWQFGVFLIEAIIGGTVPMAIAFEAFGTVALSGVQSTTAEVVFDLDTTVAGNSYQGFTLVESNPANFLSASNTVEFQLGAAKNPTSGVIPPVGMAVGDVDIALKLPVVAQSTVTVSAANLITGGASGTCPLGPLTLAGTPGSLTIVNGIITAFTPPT